MDGAIIDIIVPCYNAHMTLDTPLLSITQQTIKDKIQVLLVDDCSDKNYDSFVERYQDSFSISCITLDQNGGPGIAREKGIENTSGKYIVFIDSDDKFFSPNSLELLFNKIEEGYDLVNSIEYDQKRERFMLLNGNVHGKIYRRKYIEDHNIHFNNTRFHEDNFFNNHVILSGAKMFELEDCTYFYLYNNQSITNIDSNEFNRLELYLKNMSDLMDLAEENHYNHIRIARFKVEKYRYLRNVYKAINDEQRMIFKEWISKYDSDFLQFIDLPDLIFANRLLNYIMNKLMLDT